MTEKIGGPGIRVEACADFKDLEISVFQIL